MSFKNRLKYLLGATFASMTLSAIALNIKTNSVRADDQPKVVVSHNIICDLVEAVAQDTVDLTCLIGKDQDPHTYRPTPGELKALEEAQLIFYGGYQLEPLVVNLLEGIETPKIAIYEEVVSDPIMSKHEHGHEGHEEHAEHQEHDHEEHAEHQEAELEPDPHVWHDVDNAVAMVELIRSILLQANPSSAEQYLANSVALTEQLVQLDAWIKDQIDTVPAGQRILVTTHDSLNYYAQAYNLEDYLTLQGLSAEGATASQVRDLSSKIEQTGVPTIFAESTTSDRVISNVARAAEVELSPNRLYADGLGESENYIQMMSHNTCSIVNGLGGTCQPFEAN